MQPRSARVEDDDDRDLRLALQMSLEEATRASNAIAGASVTGQSAKTSEVNRTETPLDVEDVELKEAIAASLRDMEEKKAAQTISPTETNKSPPVTVHSAPASVAKLL
jgi:hepatocyte growth factor-regulated tyrosine kinase substrate